MGWTKQLLRAGTGAKPTAGRKVTVHCTGIVEATNKKFWSTKDPGQSTFSFTIGRGEVIRGWDEGMMTMQVGEESRFVMTSDYAYGAGGFPAWGIPPNATLIFDVEMLAV